MDLKQTELIEAYLRGELSAADKAAFETQLSQDPLFKSEIELQGDIVNSLKTFRKNELKARLNNIDVTSGSFISVGAFKLLTTLFVTGFLGFTGYYFYNLTPVEQQSTQTESVVTATPGKNDVAQKVDKQEAKTTSSVSEEKVEAPKPKTLAKNTTRKKEVTEKVISPNVIDSFAEHTGITKENNIAVSEDSKTIASEGIAEIEISHEEKAAKELKYKYLNKKLYLYGDFGSVAYELLELNSNLGKKLFLFHNNNYYQLVENRTTISPLKPIVDTLVIQELDTLRQNKTN